MTRHDLTHLAVYAAVVANEPATLLELRQAMGLPHGDERGTLRNRVLALVGQGLLVEDEGRPRRYALNHLRVAP